MHRRHALMLAVAALATISLSLGCVRKANEISQRNAPDDVDDVETTVIVPSTDLDDPAIPITEPAFSEPEAPQPPTRSFTPEPQPAPTPEPEPQPEPTLEPAPEADVETIPIRPISEVLEAMDLAVSETASNKPADAPQADVAEAEEVLLGSPELTAGIPGEGPLTMEQIEKWLADPKNHAPLTVKLPRGLDAAAAQIKGLDENPLTRAKIELGRQLYFDRRLSCDSTISCADCHHPDEGYARNTRFGIGVREQEGGRNSPVSYNRIFSEAQFWDGRAATLEDQAVGPIANPIEMDNTHEACVESLRAIPGYRAQFEKIFEDGVTIDNVGRALASFERVLVTGPSAYDHYEPLRSFLKATLAEGEDPEDLKEDDPDLYEEYQELKALADEKPMSESARRGRELFFSERSNCTACHAGANFTDELYHNLGVGMDQEEPDLGRYEVTKEDKDRGAFKTPTVRNVALTAPYMHDGSQKTLEEVVEWYAKGGHPNPWLSEKVKKLDLNDQDKKDLVEFMKALTGDLPPVEQARLPEAKAGAE